MKRISPALTACILVGALPSRGLSQEGSEETVPEIVREPSAGEDSESESWSSFMFTGENLSGRGLLNFQDPFPISELHLQMPVNTLKLLEKGDGEFEFQFIWSNSFVLEDDIEIDLESYRLDLGGWYALDDHIYFGASLPFIFRDGGILDPIIDDFHEAFGFEGGGRDQRGRNQYEVSVIDEDGRSLSLDRGFGIGDLTLKSHWIVNRGGPHFPAVAIQGFIGLPTSTDDFGSDGLDLGISLSFYKTLFEIVHLHGSLGAMYYADARVSGFPFEKIAVQAAGGVELAVTENFSFILQAMSYSPLLTEIRPLDQTRSYLAGGIKWEFLEGVELEFSVIENLEPFTNSSDIAIIGGFGFEL